MYELLTAAAEAAPVPGNAHGSYITMRSKNGLIFGVINIIGNFGAHLSSLSVPYLFILYAATVFQDQAYFQRAIASRPSSTVKAYLLGGLAWYVFPLLFGSLSA
jgi:Na+/proline symporter